MDPIYIRTIKQALRFFKRTSHLFKCILYGYTNREKEEYGRTDESKPQGREGDGKSNLFLLILNCWVLFSYSFRRTASFDEDFVSIIQSSLITNAIWRGILEQTTCHSAETNPEALSFISFGQARLDSHVEGRGGMAVAEAVRTLYEHRGRLHDMEESFHTKGFKNT
jgi:hypothetical protein